MEEKIQKRLVRFLKSKGCYVIKTKPGPGTPVGCPDVFAFYEGWYGVFECKASEKAPFQTLQKQTLAKFQEWTTTWVVYPENYDEVEAELKQIL